MVKDRVWGRRMRQDLNREEGRSEAGCVERGHVKREAGVRQVREVRQFMQRVEVSG